jgi:hypothetical protein
VGVIVAGSITRPRQGRIVLAAVVVCAVGETLVGLLPSIAGVWLALAALGVATGYANIIVISWIQRRVDHAMIGRVMSLVMLMGFGITPLSLALSGLIVDVNATAMFVGAGLLVLATAIVVAVSGWVAMFDAPAPAVAVEARAA